jgi:hypothetical protein
MCVTTLPANINANEPTTGYTTSLATSDKLINSSTLMSKSSQYPKEIAGTNRKRIWKTNGKRVFNSEHHKLILSKLILAQT